METSGAMPPEGIARRVLDAVGLALLGTGLVLLVRVFLRWPIQSFDEGNLLTGSMLVHDGEAPYRDFYTSYPPGIYLTIAGLWKLVGITPMALRYLAIGLQAGLAAAAGLVAGRMAGRRFSPLAAGLVLAWLTMLLAIPYAWLAGLLAALAFVERLAAAFSSGRRAAWLSAGVALGLVGVYRHDLFVYLTLAALPPFALLAVRRPAPGLPGAIGSATRLLLPAAASVLAVVWVPTFLRADAGTVVADLFLDQVRYAMPSRNLPFPELFSLRSTPLGLLLPALACQPFEGAALITLAGPGLCLAAVLLAWSRSRRLEPAPLFLGSLSLAVLPQLLGRTDLEHALLSVAPALAAGAAIAEYASARGGPQMRAVVPVPLALLLVLPVSFHCPMLFRSRPPVPAPDQPSRYAGLPEASDELWRARREVLAFLDRNGRPGDPLFIGCFDHRYPVVNEVELYFLADRRPATRHAQFDPGLTGRREVQEEIVRDLERTRPAAVVLSERTIPAERNPSVHSGSDLLDRYLRSRYEPAGRVGPYLLLVRR